MALDLDLIIQILLRERLRVTALASAIARDVHAADDIFQQVVLEALEFRGPDHVLAWALRTARHRAVDCARGRRLRLFPDEVLEALEARWADPVGDPISDRGEALHGCLGQLTAPARELLRMRYAERLPVAEVAARLRRTADAVYQTLSRVHRLLRACVERKLLTESGSPGTQGVHL